LEIPIPKLPWPELCKAVCDKFEKDEHNSLLRQFFRIKQTEGVVDYIEHFDGIVHQILAHDPKFSTSTITNRFIDGLKDEIRAVVLVHRPGNLDTASSIALLQEESSKDAPQIEFRKHVFKYSNRASSSTSGSPLLGAYCGYFLCPSLGLWWKERRTAKHQKTKKLCERKGLDAVCRCSCVRPGGPLAFIYNHKMSVMDFFERCEGNPS